MAFHLFNVSEAYSNADGTVQFVELLCPPSANSEHSLNGHTLTVTSGDTTHTLVFNHNLNTGIPTGGRTVLIATAGFQTLTGITPDYIIPDGFLFLDGGTINFADFDVVTYGALPGGHDSLNDGGAVLSVTAAATPQNFAGVAGSINNEPELEAPVADQVIGVGQVFSLAAGGTFSDEDGDAFEYNAQLVGGGSLPGWLILDGNTGAFSGTPDSAGSFDIEFYVTDGFGGETADQFTLQVISGHVLNGTNAANTINGTAFDDSISGGGGNDSIRFLSANLDLNDTVAGGTGTDEIRITDDATVVDADFAHVSTIERLFLAGTGAQSVTLGAQFSSAGIGIVNAVGASAATIDLAATSGNITVSTGGGADTVTGGAGNANFSTAAGNDSIRFASANFDLNDTIDGGAGVDEIRITDNALVVDGDFTNASSIQALVLAGGAGQGVTLGAAAEAAGVNSVDASAGNTSTINLSAYAALNTTLTTGLGKDTVSGGGGNDKISTSTGNDSLSGGAGNDSLSGGIGADAMDGGPGNDTYQVNNELDSVTDSGGIDLVRATIDYTLADGIEKLLLPGSDLLNGTGNDLANVITGNINANQLSGMGGNDTLVGGAGGFDMLNGGAGADVFLFKETPAGDTILDFQTGVDKIRLDNAVFTAFASPGGVTAANVQVATSGAITAGSGDADDFLKYETDTGKLHYDADGVGDAPLQLIVTVQAGGLPAVLDFTAPGLDVVIV